MDKELLRIVIIASGLLIIIGLLIWSYLNSQYNHDQASNALRDMKKSLQHKLKSKLPESPSQGTTQKLVKKPSEWGDFEDPEEYTSPKLDSATDNTPITTHATLPRLIQLSIVANNEEGFNGKDLDDVFNIIGFEYAPKIHIYERLDIDRRVDYCVGSMVNPGTFPASDLDMFYTPGVTFYMQPQELPDAASVFDDLIRTINLVVTELDGIVWDATRTPLTETTLRALRKSLQVSH